MDCEEVEVVVAKIKLAHFPCIFLMFAIPKCLTHINIQRCISQTQQNFIMFIIVLGQHVSILTESSSGPSKIQILTLYIYVCVIHFGMANIKFVASQDKTINLYNNTRSKLLVRICILRRA